MSRDIWYGNKNKLGVLLVHGFTGTPKEMEGLAKYLAKKNLRCLSIFLRGHGEEPECLLNCTFEDWLDDLERGFRKLEKDGCKKIWIAGYSLGGPLAEAYAIKNKKVAGICLLGGTLSRIGILKFLGDIGAGLEKYIFINFNLKTNYLHYTKVPLKSAREVVKCFEKFGEVPEEFKIPVLVVHAKNDEMITRKDGMKFFEKIKAKNKKLVILEKSTHGMVVDKEKEKVFKEVYSFIMEHGEN